MSHDCQRMFSTLCYNFSLYVDMQTYLCNGKYKHFSSDFVTSIIDKRVILWGDFKGNAHQF